MATTPTSSSQQRYSNDCLTQIGKSIVKKKLKATEMTIDARTYTDVQSNGLAGRIVKYQENDARLRRSQTTGSLYKRPGHFPLVNLKKTQIPCTVRKKNLSMTRISPPEKSLFYGNTLSSLLRSNSIVCLQKSDEELSCENRPIMHPPPTNETVPTRSVLDVLKEISRKRINSGEEEDTTDFSVKKYCSRDGKDVETPKGSLPPIYHRSPVYTSAYLPSTALSPQKQAVRNFNNDISSSLSSSLIYTNKRKIYDTPSKQTSPLAEDSMQRLQFQEGKRIKYDIKQQQQQQLQQQQQQQPQKVEPSVSTPSVSSTTSNATNGKQRLTLFNKSAEDTSCTASNEEISNDLHIEADTCAGVKFIKPKKGNLLSGTKHPLIQRTIKSKLALMLSGLRGELYQGSDEDETDCKKKTETNKQTEKIALNTTAVVTSNVPIMPIVSTTTTTTTTAVPPTKTTVADNKPNFAFMAPSIKTVTATESKLSTGSTAVKPNVATLNFPTTVAEQTTKTAAPATTSSSPGFAFGVGNSTITTSAAGTSNAAAAKPISTNSFDFGLNKTSETAKPAFAFGDNGNNNQAAKVDAVKPNFSFGVNQLNNAKNDAAKPSFNFDDKTNVTSNTAEKVEPVKPSFSFGDNTLNNNTNNSNAANVEPVKPNFSFGDNTFKSNNNNAANVESVKPNFAFGDNTHKTNVTNNNMAKVEAIKPNFSFGGNAFNNNATNNNNTVNVESAKPNFSFGGNAFNNNATNNHVTKAVESVKPNFTFGGNAFNNNAAKSDAAKPNFSFGDNTFKNNATNNNAANVEAVKPTFSFGNNTFKNTATNSNASKVEAVKPTFCFGDNTFKHTTTNNNAPKVEAVKPNFSFGENKTSAPAFTFEGTSSTATNNKPNFGFGSATNRKTFEFNSPVSAVKPLTSEGNSATTTNNIFGSAIKPFQSDTGSSGAATNNLFGVAVKPFTSDANATNNPFGTAIKPTISSNNLFGSAMSNPTTPSFNFTATNGTNSNSTTFTPINNNNMFAPNTATNNEPINNLFAPPKSAGPSDRPIRRATRRLNNKQ